MKIQTKNMIKITTYFFLQFICLWTLMGANFDLRQHYDNYILFILNILFYTAILHFVLIVSIKLMLDVIDEEKCKDDNIIKLKLKNKNGIR